MDSQSHIHPGGNDLLARKSQQAHPSKSHAHNVSAAAGLNASTSHYESNSNAGGVDKARGKGGADDSMAEIDNILNDLQHSSRKKAGAGGADELGKVDLILHRLIDSKMISKK